jgi:hypothetical protein
MKKATMPDGWYAVKERFERATGKELHLAGFGNTGPAIHPLEIRRAVPRTVIHGQIPPFTLRDGSPEEIVATVRRDIDSVGGDGGLVECPAGEPRGLHVGGADLRQVLMLPVHITTTLLPAKRLPKSPPVLLNGTKWLSAVT